MPLTPNQYRDRLRLMLDDADNSPFKAGVFWDTEDLTRELDASQFSVVTALYEMGAHWNIQGLVTRVTVTGLGSNLVSTPLPTDYMFPLSATINGRPCRMHSAGVGVALEDHNHYGLSIEGGDFVFVGGSAQEGIFKYIRKPASFALQPVTPRTELSSMCYMAIIWHAASALGMKDDSSNTRYFKHYQRAMQQIMQQPETQRFYFGEEVM